MKITRKPLQSEVTLLRIGGELDAYTGPQLREELAGAATEGARWLVLDVSQVEYIDSVGLGIIVGAAKGAVEREGNLAVVGPRPNVLRVFEISGTRELLNVVGTVAEARERLCWPEGGSEDIPAHAGSEDIPAHADGGCEDTCAHAEGGEP